MSGTIDTRKLPTAAEVVLDEHKVLGEDAGKRTLTQTRCDELDQSLRRRGALKSAKQDTQNTASGKLVDWQKGTRALPAAQISGKDPDADISAPKAPKEEPPQDGNSSPQYLSHGVFPTFGLSLSGGGIRSAAFCTGALQAMQRHDIFKYFDYFSTVSGGGYIGSTVTLNTNAGKGFVLFEGDNQLKDTNALKSIRNNANYLKFGYLTAVLKNVAIYLRGLTANVIIVATLLFALAAITLFANPTIREMTSPDIFGWKPQKHFGFEPSFIFTFTAFFLAVIFVFNAFWAIFAKRAEGLEAGTSSGILWLPAAWIVVVLVTAFFELQPFVVSKMIGTPGLPEANNSCRYDSIQAKCTSLTGLELPAGASCSTDHLVFSCSKPGTTPAANKSSAFKKFTDWISTLIAPFVAFVAFSSQWLGNVFKQDALTNTWTGLLKRHMNKIIVWFAGILFMLAMWLIYLKLVYWGVLMTDPNATIPEDAPNLATGVFGLWNSWTQRALGPGWLFAALALICYGIQSCYSPNSNSLHRLYRDRLGEAFCFVQRDDKPDPAGNTALSALKSCRPIPIINAAINLQRSRVVKSKGRMADFFTFTPFTVGSDATGFAKTLAIQKLEEARNLDIATAIAISGAAASSNMGSQSLRPLAALLAFFNVRLGYWFPNPKRTVSDKGIKPNLWYFVNEVLGNLNEDSNLVYLTDGGHIENLGLYELIRRRCRLIVAVDAEADPKMNFGSFVTLQRYARIDLGARIELPWAQLAEISREAMADKVPPKKGPHCAIGWIEYENGGTGVLLYIKASITGDENDYILDYNRRNETFPHESTGDQMFSEEQFEVYRALGFHAVNDMLKGEDRIQSDAGLEHLNDNNAEGNGVREAAILLGLQTKAYPARDREDNISLVKMVQDPTQPVPLKIDISEGQLKSLINAISSKKPKASKRPR
jgi:Patatin-like phospholipase